MGELSPYRDSQKKPRYVIAATATKPDGWGNVVLDEVNRYAENGYFVRDVKKVDDYYVVLMELA